MRPRGTPPTPSAMSSGSAPVEIASTLSAPWSPEPHQRALRRTPSRSGVTAACSAWSRAFASFSPASLRLACLADLRISSPLSHLSSSSGRSEAPTRPSASYSAPAPAAGGTGRAPDESDGRTGTCVRVAGPAGLSTSAGLRLARRLGPHPRHRQVRPERPLLGLVEAALHQPLLHLPPAAPRCPPSSRRARTGAGACRAGSPTGSATSSTAGRLDVRVERGLGDRASTSFSAW